MKISKIHIKDFHQFKDFTLDLTYPQGHEKDFINDLKAKINNKSPYKFDRFFTATKMCLENMLTSPEC